MTVAFQFMCGILERWNNKVTPLLSKPHGLSYRLNTKKRYFYFDFVEVDFIIQLNIFLKAI